MLSVSMLQCVCVCECENECVNRTGIDNDFSYGFAFGLHKKINHLSQITKPKDARDRQKSCWANKLHTEQTSEQHAQRLWPDRESVDQEQQEKEKHRRELGFYTTIISFYLVVYYSTVSVRRAGKQAGSSASSYLGQPVSHCVCLTTFFKLSSAASQQHHLILFFLFCSIFFRLWWLWQPWFLLTVPTATILGGPDLHVDKGSTINLTCTVKFSPEPPAYIFWYHHEEVIKLYCYISASMPSLFYTVYSSSAFFLKVSAGSESCLTTFSMSLIFVWRRKRECWGKQIIMISKF